MRGTLLSAAVALTLAVLATPVGASAAAAEIGTRCSADQLSMGGYLMVQERAPNSGLPVGSPSAGVLTSWTFRADAFGAEPEPGYMKVLRPEGTGEFRVVGESTGKLLGPGTQTFPERIPVQAGDRVSYFSTGNTFYCDTAGAEDLVWSRNANLIGGQAGLFAANAPGIQVPVSATIEADADGDGYGDGSQDGCPQLASVHETPCPALTLGFFSLATRKAIFVYVTASSSAPIAVAARAGKAKLKTTVQQAGPGKIAKFRLPLTAAVTRKLAATPRTKTLGVRITASGTDALGVLRTETRTLKLKGQGRPPRHA